MGKGLRITSIIFVLLITATEVYAAYVAGLTISVISSNDISNLALVATIPMFFLSSCIVLILSIINAIINKKLKKTLVNNQLPVLVIDKLCGIIPLIFTLVDVVFIIFLLVR